MKNKKTIVSVLGIRPDLIRCSDILKKFDVEFNHILLWTGQHYDPMLSDVFFNDLEIRKPDYNLNMGKIYKSHHELSGMLGSKIIELINSENIKTDAFFFLGDSNTVSSAMPLKKEYGNTIKNIHCEAGMRSGDKRMLEEINRTVCDHCSDIHFVYHEDYKINLVKENIPIENIYVVGNTIVEVCNKIKTNIMLKPKHKNYILMDIHRPENFKYKTRLNNVFVFANQCIENFKVPVKMIKFNRTMDAIDKLKIDVGKVELIDLMSYKDFLTSQYNSLFLISDSGSAQEEAALLNTPVIVPRNFTERPQSVWSDCSIMINIDDSTSITKQIEITKNWIYSNPKMDCSWLGDGNTADKIISILKNYL